MQTLRFIREDHHDKCRKTHPGKARLPHPHGRDRGHTQRQVRPSGRQPGHAPTCCPTSISVEMRVDPDRLRRTRTVTVWCSPRATAAPGLYAALAERGFFPVADLPDSAPDRQLSAGPPQHEHRARRGYDHRQPGPGRLCRLPAWHWPPSTQASALNVYALAGRRRGRGGRVLGSLSCLPHHYGLDPTSASSSTVNRLQIDGPTRERHEQRAAG